MGASPTWSNTRVLATVMPIIIAAAALRLFHLDYHDLRGDEAFSIFFVERDWPAIIGLLRTGEPHPPLYFFALKAWMSLTGQSEFATRWLSAAAGVALVPLVFAFWRRLGEPRTGAIAAALVAANPYHIWNGQDVRMYTMATTFSAGVLYFGLRVAGTGRPVLGRDVLGLTITSLLAMGSHYVAVVLVVAVNGVIAVRWLARGRPEGPAIRFWALGLGATTLAYLPWLVVGLPVLGPSYGGNMYSPAPIEAIWKVLTVFAAGELASAQVASLLALAAAAAACLGAVALARSHPHAAALMMTSICIPFVALLVASSTRPVFSPRYLLLTSPVFFLLSARGLAFLPSSLRIAPFSRATLLPLTAALASAVITLTAIAVQSYYLDRGGEGSGNWRPFVGHIVRSASADDLIVVNHLDPAFFYYYRMLGGTAQATTQPPWQTATREDIDAALDAMMRPGRTVWFVPDGAGAYDKTRIVASWLDRHAVRIRTMRVQGMELELYRVPAGESLTFSFGDIVRLERYEMRGLQGQPGPGETVTLDLVWRALAPIERDYTISAQLLDDQGQLVAQSDSQPANGRAPTSTWRTSEHVVDTRTLRVPNKPGIYRLAVAVYDLSSLQRLSVSGASDNLALLGTVEVRQ